MSEQSAPVPPDEFSVEIDETDAGHQVVVVVDGSRRSIGDAHPDRERAEFHAEQVRAGAERWDDAADVSPAD